ncbi:MAG TPA: thioredoxin family protein [Thermoanaerobaculia bacterium]|nr:thioredoxin family protein [Thermoanaerobaculia bacterium]
MDEPVDQPPIPVPPSAGGFDCPRCGLRQPAAAECARCGIVFAKLGREPRRASAGGPAPAVRVSATDSQQGVTGWLGWLAAAVLAVAAVLAWPRSSALPPSGAAGAPAAGSAAAARSPQRLALARRAAAASHRARGAPAAGPAGQPAPAESSAAPEAALETPTPVRFPYSWYEGAQGYREAMAEAEENHKPIAVYFRTDWCPYCRRMDEQLLRTAQVTEYLRFVVKVRVNPESGPVEKALAGHYGVSGYPSFFIQATPGFRAPRLRIYAWTQGSDGAWHPTDAASFVAACAVAASASGPDTPSPSPPADPSTLRPGASPGPTSRGRNPLDVLRADPGRSAPPPPQPRPRASG